MGMLIGAVYGHVAEPVINNLKPIFAVMLTLYLVHMSTIAGARLKDLGKNHLFIISFGLFMPLIGASFGLAKAWLFGLWIGGMTLLATLGASAPYIIVVPAVFEQARPEANIAQALVASLAITYSFNVIWGISLYHHVAGLLFG